MNRAWTTALVATALTGTAMLVSHALASPVASVGRATEAQAQKITGRPDVNLKPPSASKFKDGFPIVEMVDPSTRESFLLEKQSGKIRGYLDQRAYERMGKLPSKAEPEIEELGRAYAARVYSASRISKMTCSIKRHAGGVETDYSVELREHIDGVPTFNRLKMRYSEGGELLGFTTIDEDVAVGTTSKLSRQDAVAAAESKSGWTKHSSADARLEIVRYRDASQRLVWIVTLQTGNASLGGEYIAHVDALSGEVSMEAYSL